MTPKDFKDSQEFAFRRAVRSEIRRTKSLTRAQRDVVLALFDLWCHHKAKGSIAPKRAVMARKCRVSERTVASVLAGLRDAGVLVTLNRGTGGRGKATSYCMDVLALLRMIGAPLPETAPGELVLMAATTPLKRVYAKRRAIAPSRRVPPATVGVSRKRATCETVQDLHPYIYNNNRSGVPPLPEPIPRGQIQVLDERTAA